MVAASHPMATPRPDGCCLCLGARATQPRIVHLSPSSGELTIGPSVNESATASNNWHVLDAYISDYDRDGSDELFLVMEEDHREYSVSRHLIRFEPVDEWSTTVDEYTLPRCLRRRFPNERRLARPFDGTALRMMS